MTRFDLTGGRPRAPRRWLTPFVLPVALVALAGCGSDGDRATATPTTVPTATATARPPTPTSPPPATSTVVPTQTAAPTPTMAPSAAAACAKLADCGQCFINERGTCISTEACAARLSSGQASCINAQDHCNPDALGDCLEQLGCGGDDDSGPCE